MSNMLGRPSDQIQLRFYEMVIELQKTPKDYGLQQECFQITSLDMQNKDILTVTILEKNPEPKAAIKKAEKGRIYVLYSNSV